MACCVEVPFCVLLRATHSTDNDDSTMDDDADDDIGPDDDNDVDEVNSDEVRLPC